MRLLIITVGVLFVSAIVGLSLKIWGDSSSFQRFEHGFYNPKAPAPIVRLDQLDQAAQFFKDFPAGAAWLEVRSTSDSQLIILNQKVRARNAELNKLSPARGLSWSRYSFTELSSVFGKIEKLEEFLSTFPTQKFVLRMMDNFTDVDRSLITLLEKFSPDKRLLIQSDIDVILRSLKDQKPLWLYGSSQSDLVKMLSLDSIWLLSAAPFRGDVFILPIRWQNRVLLNKNLMLEIKRRKKDFYVGPLESIEDLRKLRDHLGEGPDAIVYGSLELQRQASTLE
jgi:hypothetical protein